jgi:hypothetical protein
MGGKCNYPLLLFKGMIFGALHLSGLCGPDIFQCGPRSPYFRHTCQFGEPKILMGELADLLNNFIKPGLYFIETNACLSINLSAI